MEQVTMNEIPGWINRANLQVEENQCLKNAYLVSQNYSNAKIVHEDSFTHYIRLELHRSHVPPATGNFKRTVEVSGGGGRVGATDLK